MESRCRLVVISSGVRKRYLEREWQQSHRECRSFAEVVLYVCMIALLLRAVIRHSRRLGYLASQYRAVSPRKAHARQTMQERTCSHSGPSRCFAFLSLALGSFGNRAKDL